MYRIWYRRPHIWEPSGMAAGPCRKTWCLAQERNSEEVRCHTEQTVFGHPLRWFAPSANEKDSYLLPALESDGPSWMVSQVRTAARIALLERDLQEQLRAAPLRRSQMVKEEVVPWDASGAASVQKTTEVRHEEMARTWSDSGC